MLGLACVVLGGIAANYTQKLKTLVKPINVKVWHATGGMAIFIMAMATVSLATYSNWFHNRMGKTPWVGKLCFWAPIILAICVARQVTQSYLPRVCSPKDTILEKSKTKRKENSIEKTEKAA